MLKPIKTQIKKETKKTDNDFRKFLPPFLMLRSGLLPYYVALICVLGASSVILAKDVLSPTNNSINKTSIIFGGLSGLAAMVFILAISQKRKKMKECAEDAVEQMNYFKQGVYDICDFKDGCPKVTQNVVQYMSKKDRFFFDKMVKNPELVQNQGAILDIAAGHLKKHPKDARLIANNIRMIYLPKSVYKKVIKACPELAHHHHHHKSR